MKGKFLVYSEGSGTSLTMPVVFGVEFCNAACSSVPPRFANPSEDGLQQHQEGKRVGSDFLSSSSMATTAEPHAALCH